MIHFVSGNIGLGLLDGFLGGLILGVGSTLLMYTHGRTVGISGITEGMLFFKSGDDKKWCYTFTLGMLVAGGILSIIRPKSFSNASDLTEGAVVFAGIIVGFGTRMGSGCTSGHGICGLSRRSPRSLAAVCTFMATGVLSASIFRETALEVLVMRPHNEISEGDVDSCIYMTFLPMILTGIVIILLFSTNQWLINLIQPNSSAIATTINSDNNQKQFVDTNTISDIDVIDNSWKHFFIEHGIALFVGLIFGLGLGLSGMTNPNKVIDFLNFAGSNGWDPSLAAVMGGGVLFNIFSFHIMSRKEHNPLLSVTITKQLSEIVKTGFHIDNMKIDYKLIIGSALFGLGWGLGGICPGPGFVAISNCSNNAHIFIPSVFIGIMLNDMLLNKNNSIMKLFCNCKYTNKDEITPKCDSYENIRNTSPNNDTPLINNKLSA